MAQMGDVLLRNSQLVDPQSGEFHVLELVSLHLGGHFWWHSDDINNGMAKGAIF